jgi:hypothetical protein
MTKFEKPGRRRTGTTRTWRASRAPRRSKTPASLRRDRAGVRGLRLRRLDVGPARALRARPDRHPDRQRQQQLLDRVDRAVPRRAGDRGGLADCTLALGFEKMEKGSLGIKYTDRTPDGQALHGDARDLARRQSRRRRRCSATPAASTWSVRLTPSTSPGSAGRTTSTRSTTPTRSSRRVHAGGHQGREDDPRAR